MSGVVHLNSISDIYFQFSSKSARKPIYILYIYKFKRRREHCQLLQSMKNLWLSHFVRSTLPISSFENRSHFYWKNKLKNGSSSIRYGM